MIEEIRIENLGVIEAAHVDLGPGLTVLTGETGAGKTMLLTALGLLLGVRADAAFVRTGAGAAAVEGRVRPDTSTLDQAREAGAQADDDGSLLLVRTVSAGVDGAPGRSRAYLGGRSVPQAVLAELAQTLVTVHGQADQARLRSPARQREALDDFVGPGHLQLLEEHRAAWARRTAVRAELDDLRARATDRTREAELLRLGLAEVERVSPQPGEDGDLAELVRRLAHAEDLRAAAAGAHAALAGDDDPSAPPGAVLSVDAARRALEAAASHDPALAALGTRVAEVGYLLGEVVADLAAYQDGLDADPAALDTAQRRLGELATLTRSYGEDVDGVLAWAGRAGLRLLELDSGDERIADLEQQVSALDERLAGLAGNLSAGRREAAGRLAAAVGSELAGLAMAGARLEVVVEPADEQSWHGADRVEMLLVPHEGAPARPLGKGASGGELSRVMLAIEVVLATTGDGPAPGTFVFDEVDAGVGGRAAVEVGRRLAALARSRQVIVVTHLAQVAAFADVQVVVQRSAELVTSADVRVVEGEDRVRELARMLSGQDSSAARTHAAELLALAGVGR